MRDDVANGTVMYLRRGWSGIFICPPPPPSFDLLCFVCVLRGTVIVDLCFPLGHTTTPACPPPPRVASRTAKSKAMKLYSIAVVNVTDRSAGKLLTMESDLTSFNYFTRAKYVAVE